ncbi:hypothetical protein RI367_006562 [Sorochytrium milnesiophthora]
MFSVMQDSRNIRRSAYVDNYGSCIVAPSPWPSTLSSSCRHHVCHIPASSPIQKLPYDEECTSLLADEHQLHQEDMVISMLPAQPARPAITNASSVPNRKLANINSNIFYFPTSAPFSPLAAATTSATGVKATTTSSVESGTNTGSATTAAASAQTDVAAIQREGAVRFALSRLRWNAKLLNVYMVTQPTDADAAARVGQQAVSAVQELTERLESLLLSLPSTSTTSTAAVQWTSPASPVATMTVPRITISALTGTDDLISPTAQQSTYSKSLPVEPAVESKTWALFNSVTAEPLPTPAADVESKTWSLFDSVKPMPPPLPARRPDTDLSDAAIDQIVDDLLKDVLASLSLPIRPKTAHSPRSGAVVFRTDAQPVSPVSAPADFEESLTRVLKRKMADFEERAVAHKKQDMSDDSEDDFEFVDAEEVAESAE